MPAKNTLNFHFCNGLNSSYQTFFCYDEPCPLLWCFHIFIGNLCAAHRSVCLVRMLLLTLIFRWEKFLNVLFFFSKVSLTSRV